MVVLSVIEEVLEERSRQDNKWGEQNHRPDTWIVILAEELGEASHAMLNILADKYREEMIQVAAVAVAAVEALDRGKYHSAELFKIGKGQRAGGP